MKERAYRQNNGGTLDPPPCWGITRVLQMSAAADLNFRILNSESRTQNSESSMNSYHQ